MNKFLPYLRTVNPLVFGVVSLALLLIIGMAYIADEWSRHIATERAERVVPNLSDPTTWNLPSFTDAASSYPADGVFLLSLSNLANGKVSLTTFSFDSSDESGFGYVRFSEGVADTCTPLPDNGMYTCASFTRGMLMIRDFVPVAEKMQYKNDTYYNDDGELVSTTTSTKTISALVLAERYYGTTSDMVLLYIGPSVYNNEVNQYSVYDIFTVADQISKVAKIQKIVPLFNANYQHSDTVFIRTDTEMSTYLLETSDLKYGPMSELLPIVSGKAVKTFPVNVYEPGSDLRKPETKSLGAVRYSFIPNASILSTNYGRGSAFDGGYSQIFNGVMSRVYFKDACSMPYTYSDFRTFMTVGSSTLKLDVSVTGANVFNVTTSYYGYEPSEWGKIIDVRDADKERTNIAAGVSFDGRPTELLMLSGISVRHTLARRLARPCDNAYYEQYQWVKQGVIYSVTVTHPDTEAKRTNAEQVELQTVLSGLVSGLEYEPTSAQ